MSLKRTWGPCALLGLSSNMVYGPSFMVHSVLKGQVGSQASVVQGIGVKRGWMHSPESVWQATLWSALLLRNFNQVTVIQKPFYLLHILAIQIEELGFLTMVT